MGKRIQAQNFEGTHHLGARMTGKISGPEHRPLPSQPWVLSRLRHTEKLSVDSAWRGDVQKYESSEFWGVPLDLSEV